MEMNISHRLRRASIVVFVGVSAWAVTNALTANLNATPTTDVAHVGGAGSAEVAPIALALGSTRAVVVGAPDVTAGAWLVSRDVADANLRLTAVSIAGVLSDRALPLASAGMQAGIAPTPSLVWVGAGSRVVSVDRQSGAALTFELPAPTGAVDSASRAPDGTVLGLGNITSVAADGTGAQVWIARYAASALTVLDAGEGSVREVPIGAAHDADRVVVSGNDVWFTVNYGPGGRLAAAVGHVDRRTFAVNFTPIFARSLVARPDGIHALGGTWSRIDPKTQLVTAVLTPVDPLDTSTEGLDASGRLVARRAGQTTLVTLTGAGLVRTIRYDQGSFINSAGARLATNSPLSFVGPDGAGTLWFAPRGGVAIYAAS